MPSDAFGSDDQDLLERARRALLSPLEHESVDPRVRDILGALRPLFEAERGRATFAVQDGQAEVADSQTGASPTARSRCPSKSASARRSALPTPSS